MLRSWRPALTLNHSRYFNKKEDLFWKAVYDTEWIIMAPAEN